MKIDRSCWCNSFVITVNATYRNPKSKISNQKPKTENRKYIHMWVIIICMHKAKSNQKSIHNHLQGADKDKRHTQHTEWRGLAGCLPSIGAVSRTVSRTVSQAGRQFNQICYKTVKVCDSDRKQDSKSHKGAVQAVSEQPREICMPRFRVERRVYHYAKRWSFCIPKQRRSVPYIHASISMQQYQCLAIRRRTTHRIPSGQLTHCTDRQQDTIQSFQHCGT